MTGLMSHPLVNAVAWTLVHFLWQGAIIAVAAALVWRALRTSAPSVRYVVGVVALAVMGIAVVVTFAGLVQRGHAPAAAATETSAPGLAGRNAAVPLSAPVPVRAARASTSSMMPASTWPALLFVLWTMGVAVLSVRLAGGWLVAARLARQAVAPSPDIAALADRVRARLALHGAVRLVESSRVTVPAVVGWLMPVVLLPASMIAGLPPDLLEALLAHEFAHVRRHDYLVNLLQSMVETVLFYHPAVWWVSHRVRAEREHACDDIAIDVCGDRVAYASALATLEHARRAPALALAATGTSLLSRIQRILTVDAPRHRLNLAPAWAAIALPVLAAIVVLPIVATSPVRAVDASSAPVAQGPIGGVVGGVAGGVPQGGVAGVVGGVAGGISPGVSDAVAGGVAGDAVRDAPQAQKWYVTPADAAKHIDQVVYVCGKVAGVRALDTDPERAAVLDFDRKSPDQTFSVVLTAIPPGYYYRSAALQTASEFDQLSVCVHGTIVKGPTGPQIYTRLIDLHVEPDPDAAEAFRGSAHRIYEAGVVAPVASYSPDPKYTSDAMRNKIQGAVELEAIVQPDGSVGAVRVVQSLDSQFGLDEQAMTMLRTWKFSPGTLRGTPVPVVVRIFMSFTLR